MINIIVNADSRYRIDKFAIQAAAIEVLKRNRISGNVEVGITIVGDRKMHEINKKYRGISSTTNILSFALEDPIFASTLQHIPKMGFVKAPDNVLRLGDIVISYPEIVKNAGFEGVTVGEELMFLVEHGVNHLLGKHHS